MSLKGAIRAAAKCVKCGAAGVGKCSCWIKLRCPRCGRTSTQARIKSDPRTPIYEVECPDCADTAGRVECRACDGQGFVMVENHGAQELQCDECGGTGDMPTPKRSEVKP